MMSAADPASSNNALAGADAAVARHADAIIRRVAHFEYVFLVAPTGYGKTEIARRIAKSAERPAAWCSVPHQSSTPALLAATARAVLGAWPDAPNQPDDVSEHNASSLLARALDVIGATTLVLDDVDRADEAAVDSLIEHLANTDSLRVVMTSQREPPASLIGLEASGRLVRVGRSELQFDAEVCGQMIDDPEAGHALYNTTGGWPIAVLVGARADQRSGGNLPSDSLLQLFLRSHPTFDRARLVVACRIDPLPHDILRWLQIPTGQRRDSEGEALLVQHDDRGGSIRQWARDALGDEPLDHAAIDEALDLLRRTGDEEALLSLAVAVGRLDTVIGDIERFCAAKLVEGAHYLVRRLIDRIPHADRSVELRISAARARQATTDHRPTEIELREIAELARLPDGRPSPRGHAVLADHLRMIGDPAVVDVCREVVAPLMGLSPRDAAGAARMMWPYLPDRIAAGELLRFLGQGATLSPNTEAFAAGRNLLESALQIIDDEHVARSQRGWLLYMETLQFITPANKAVFPARTIALELWRARHSDAALRLGELAILEFFSGLLDRARSTIELAREASAELGNDLAAIPLNGLECALDVIDHPQSPEFVDAFDAAIFELLDHGHLAVFHQVFAAEFGVVQLQLGNPTIAARYLAIAEQSPDTFLSTSFSLRRRRLHALLRTVDDDARGTSELSQLRDEATRVGRPAFVELIDADLAGRQLGDRPDLERGDGEESLRIVALAPAFSILRGDSELPCPSGFTAKLLALLVASSGVVTVDVALEALWPDTDPHVSRNRLHGVLLRLRRTLGFGPDGPVTCRDDLIRLDAGPLLSCDAWDLEDDLAAGRVTNEPAELLSEQFRYDDRVTAYREHLARRVTGR